jgi:multicomponent Na+:H+ antiporter subunit F
MSAPWLDHALMGLLAVLIALLAAAVVRVVRGPHLADRVVALDLVSHVTVCIIGTTAMLNEEGPLLDAALVLSLLAFLGTVAFARYLERGGGTS